MSQEPVAFFVHIPKTAGSTLRTIIQNNYRPKEILFTDSAHPHPFDEAKTLEPTEKDQINVVVGHYAYGMHQFFLQTAVYFTVLREPIARSLSEFYHINRYPNHGLHQLVRSGQMTIHDFLDHLGVVHSDNIQTRQIAGTYRTGPGEPCTPEMLTLAKKNLVNKFDLFGLTKRFDEFLLEISELLGWDRIYYQRQNVTQNRPKKRQLSPAEMTRIRAANQYDLELYAFAQERLNERMAQKGKRFANQLRAFHLRNESRQATVLRRFWAINRRVRRTVATASADPR